MINKKLPRIRTERGEAVVLPNGTIKFRHYLISGHAQDRFVERCKKPISAMVQLLEDAYYIDRDWAKSGSVLRIVANAMERGGYVLYRRPAFFIITPSDKHHVVSTVLSPDSLG